MVKPKPGDLIRIEYTGRISSDGKVFETTSEKVARDSGVWSSASKYGPKITVFGKNAMLKGLEESIAKMEEGQKQKFKIPANKAFGPKFPELVRLMSQSNFAKSGVRPEPGLMLMVDGVPATVKSVSSGRVLLDFNHPFAGKDVEYDVHLLEVIAEPRKKAEEMAKLLGVPIKIETEGGKNTIIIPNAVDLQKRKGMVKALKDTVGDWAEVKVEGSTSP